MVKWNTLLYLYEETVCRERVRLVTEQLEMTGAWEENSLFKGEGVNMLYSKFPLCIKDLYL